MAPFKLKFRMGSSRSTSQEHDPDPQVNEALLNHYSAAIGASSSTIDSADCNSLGSLGTASERKHLLPHKNNNLRLGYLSQSIAPGALESASGAEAVPSTPPPSYEHVLQERQLSGEENSQRSHHSSASNLRNSVHLDSLEQLSMNNSQCTDPDCRENYANNEQRLQRQHESTQAIERNDMEGGKQAAAVAAASASACAADGNESETDIDNRKESIDSTELLISRNMTAPLSQEHVIENCTGDCQHYDGQYDGGECDGNRNGGNNDFCDPLMNHSSYCNNDSHYNDEYTEEDAQHQSPPEYMQRCGGGGGGGAGGGENTDSDDGWESNQMSNIHQQHHDQYQQHQQHQHQQHQQQHQQQQQERSLTPEIISNKSSKEIYKDLAKQWGITCKMSDGCRCMECQSHYFDCEFDDNEHQKTDGGLGAGTPMFISEVMHGTACNIL